MERKELGTGIVDYPDSVEPACHSLFLNEFNDTKMDYREDQLVHQLFEEQVERSPKALALVCGPRCMTYAELNKRANQLARHIKNQGMGPEEVVGVCIERSLEMIVGLISILKAGGAYVPLDPNYPADRLRFMLEDSKPKLLLTQVKLRVRLPETNIRVLIVGRETMEIPESAGGNENLSSHDVGITAKNVVYVIYTSGTTGRPKGISMSHRSMVNLIEWHRRSLRGGAGQRVLQYAALNFDVAFQEIFSTLCTGGTLVLAGEEVRRDPHALLELLRAQSIERFFVTPLVLRQVADCCAEASEVPRSLRDIIAAGEQLRITSAIQALFQWLDGCRLHNHYGPTETHVVTTWTLAENPTDWPVLPPIGKPISNASIYVLDQMHQPVPPNATGEIYIGGDCVARGYHDRPTLTALRFVADPFSDDHRARLYKTGDLGRWRPDGVLEYLGRNDSQVKVRGFRVELGEVEAVLESYRGVKRSVVVLREDAPGDKRLVAYIVVEAGEQRASLGDAADEDGSAAIFFVPRLRTFLKDRLPDYMIPAAIALLDELPTSPNGKIDRNALPAPSMERQIEQAYAGPTSPMEEVIVGAWSEVLGVYPVGIDDNFFELGGDSVVALELVSRVAARLGIDGLAIFSLFEGPTVREMAQLIAREILRIPDQVDR